MSEMALPVQRHHFTVDEYHQMAAAGVFLEDDRVELIEGEILDMAAVGGPHIRTLVRLTGLFARGLPDVGVQVQSPIRLDEHSEPEPDLCILPSEASSYPAWPRDVLLLIEVSDTTLRYDRDVKVPLYARAGIPEVWVVDLTGRRVLVYRDPSPDGYRTTRTVRGDESLSPQHCPSLVFSAAQILGGPTTV
jgi:Uma2 family endonuclease